MSYATAWTVYHYVVPVCIALSAVLLIRSAWKDKLVSALIAGALLGFFVGAMFSPRLSGFGEYVRNLIRGTMPPDMEQDFGTKRFIRAVLWTVIFTVPGPFVAVAVQVMFRSIRRIREEKNA